MNRNERADVVIVGGGLCGLAVATLLARKGRKVTVLERAQEPGGRARSREEAGGIFNQGPHALYRGGAAMRVLKALGVKPVGKTPPVSAYFAEGKTLHHFGLAGMKGLSAGESLELMRTLGRVTFVNAKRHAAETEADWLDAHVKSPKVRALLESLIRVSTYTNAPERLSAEVALYQLQIALRKNVLYLDGGWSQLVTALEQKAKESGVQLRTGAKVDEVLHDGRVRGVRLGDGTVLEAEDVVLAGGNALTHLLKGEEAKALRARADALVQVQAACLDVSLSALPVPERLATFGLDRPLYFSVHSATAKLTPGGGHVLHAAYYLPPGGHVTRETLEGELDLVQPGWREKATSVTFLPQLTVMHALVERPGFAGRIPTTVPEIRGLHLAGDWVGGEGLLLDASLASAERVALEMAGLEVSRAGASG